MRVITEVRHTRSLVMIAMGVGGMVHNYVVESWLPAWSYWAPHSSPPPTPSQLPPSEKQGSLNKLH